MVSPRARVLAVALASILLGCSAGAVSCGGHTASSCGECVPAGKAKGQNYCNGDCKWVDGSCLSKLQAKRATAGGGQVQCSTTAGDFTISLQRSLSPLGVDRFFELVDSEFFDGQIIFRVLPGFLLQFGVAGYPQVQAYWDARTISDEPHRGGAFEHGTVSFAGAGPNTRSCHIFIALAPHGTQLGGPSRAHHETALGKVTSGIDVLSQVVANAQAAGYGDLTDLLTQITTQGNSAAASYPRLDRFKKCRVLADGEL